MNNNIVSVFLYGSTVYGTFKHCESDLDVIAVVNDPAYHNTEDEIRKIAYAYFPNYIREIDVNMYTQSEFSRGVESHEISFLECVFAKNALIFGLPQLASKIDLGALRESISRKSSNSWVKGKKKLDSTSPDFAPRIGKKSVWHSLRILMFGVQLAEHQRIYDFSCANSFYDEIMNLETWDQIDERFRLKKNQLATQFRSLTPK